VRAEGAAHADPRPRACNAIMYGAAHQRLRVRGTRGNVSCKVTAAALPNFGLGVRRSSTIRTDDCSVRRFDLAGEATLLLAMTEEARLFNGYRKHMEGAKQMLEGKLQDAGVQLMECERQLAEALGAGGGGSAGRSPKAGASGRVSRHDSAAQVCACGAEPSSVPRLPASPVALDRQ